MALSFGSVWAEAFSLVLDSSNPGSFMSLRSLSCIDFPLFSCPACRLGTPPPASDLVRLGLFLTPKSITKPDSSMLLLGRSWSGFSPPASDFLHPDAATPLQGISRAEGQLAVVNFAFLELSLLPRSMARSGAFLMASGSVRHPSGYSLLALIFACPGLSSLLHGFARADIFMSLVGFSHSDALLPLKAISCLESHLLVAGIACFGLPVLVLDVWNLRPSMLPRSCSHLGPTLAAPNTATLGSPMPLHRPG